jgi:hypothetical protein
MEVLSAPAITENFFDVLGVRPIVGRTLAISGRAGTTLVE